jgi:hypothetical protein
MAIRLNNSFFRLNNGSFRSVDPSTVSGIVTSGVVLYLDAGNASSYPGSGTSWFDVYNNVTGSLINGPTYTSAGASSSINFDGTDDYLLFNPSSSLTGLESLTANMWLKIKDQTGVLFYKSDDDTARGWYIEYGSNINSSGIAGFGFTAVSAANNLRYYIDKNQYPLETWTNFTVTWDGVFPNTAGTAVKIYIDGVQSTTISYERSGSGTHLPDTNADILSFAQNRITGAGDFVSGSVGIISLYDRDLTAAEVLQNYNATKARYQPSESVFLADASNVASYPGTGTSWYDISGNQNTGSLINGPIYNGSSSFTLDGVDDNIEFNSGSAINNLTTATWTMWVKWTQDLSVTSTSLLYKSDNNNTAGWFIGVDSTRGGIGIAIVASTNKRYYLPSSETPARNTWYMLTVTWDGTIFSTGGINIYINGVKNTTTPQTNTAGAGSRTTDAAQIFDIGNSRPGSAFHFGGEIGFVQIHSGVLTAADVLQKYNDTKATYGL